MKKVFQTTLATALAAHGLLVGAVLSTATAHAGVVVAARPVVVARPVTISRPVAAPVTRAPAATQAAKPAVKSTPVAISVSPAKGMRPMVAVPVVMIPVTSAAGRDDCSSKSKADCKK